MNIQAELPLSVFAPKRDSKQAAKERRHLLILGRPRRLRSELKPPDWDRVERELNASGLEIIDCFDFVSELGASNKIPSVEIESEKSEVIKVSIPPVQLTQLDRIRTLAGGFATRPKIVRDIVEDFVFKTKTHDYGSVSPINKRPGLKGRRIYVKVPFTPSVLRAIGHLDRKNHEAGSTGLCRFFGTNRQGVIDIAISGYLSKTS